MIRKIGDKYLLMSKDGKKKLGEFNTKFEAEEREKQIVRAKRAKAMKGYDSERKENMID